MIKKCLCASLFLLLYTSSTYAEWNKLSGGDDSSYTQYIDFDTVKMLSKEKWRIWELIDYKATQTTSAGSKYKSTKIYWEVECTEFKHKVLTAARYSGQMGSGESLGTIQQGEYNYIVPGSIGAILATPLCTALK